MSTGTELPRDYWISAETKVPPNDYKESWIEERINFTLKKDGKVEVTTTYKNKVASDSITIRAYLLLHLLSAVYEKLAISQIEPAEVHYIRSDTGRPLLDVKNEYSQVQFSLLKWVSPDWIELPKVSAMAMYLANMRKIDPVTYTMFVKSTRLKQLLPEFSPVKWKIDIF